MLRRVLAADDHASTRGALRTVLSQNEREVVDNFLQCSRPALLSRNEETHRGRLLSSPKLVPLNWQQR